MAQDGFVNQVQRIGDTENGLAPGEAAVVVDSDHFVVTDVPSEVVRGNRASITGYTKLQVNTAFIATREYADAAGAASAAAWTVTDVKTADYAASVAEFVRYDPSGGGFAITIPAPTAENKGERIGLKNITASTNTVTLTADGGATIEGAASVSLNGARWRIVLVSDGVSEWMIESAT